MLTESQALAAGKGKAAHALDSGCMSFPYLGQTGPVPGPEGMSGTVKASYGLVRKLTDVPAFFSVLFWALTYSTENAGNVC